MKHCLLLSLLSVCAGYSDYYVLPVTMNQSMSLCTGYSYYYVYEPLSDTLCVQVVCSECHHVSVTYEPFMYLSVPLPHAMERQMSKYQEVSLFF